MQSTGPGRLIMLHLAALVLALSGCALGPSASPDETAGISAFKVPVLTDYPGWTIKESQGPNVHLLEVGSGQLRQTYPVFLRSPDGTTCIVATYMRSAPGTSQLEAKPWKTLDTLYKGAGWRSAAAKRLYRRMRDDHPYEIMMGAYEVTRGPDATRIFYVGYYGTRGSKWIRGEHVYALDANTGTWRQTAFDSRSGDYWIQPVPVP